MNPGRLSQLMVTLMLGMMLVSACRSQTPTYGNDSWRPAGVNTVDTIKVKVSGSYDPLFAEKDGAFLQLTLRSITDKRLSDLEGYKSKIDEFGATAVLTKQAITKLTASDGAVSDWFGYSVAIDGDTIVVGAYQDDTNTGSAYVFDRNTGGANHWGQVKKLVASDRATWDYFGLSVAISGDTVVVGAYNDEGTGSAYVFERNAGGTNNWGQVKKLVGLSSAFWNNFGFAVAISGDIIATGSPGEDLLVNNAGVVYVFMRNTGGSGNWGQVKRITASDGADSDGFGSSVFIVGDTLAVGAEGDDDQEADSGSVYVLERNLGGADQWGEVKKLTASDGAANDSFGRYTSLSGDTLVIAAYQDDDHGDGSGSAYVFERNAGGVNNWGEVKKLTAFDGAAGDWFGAAVSVEGDTVIVGAYKDDGTRSNSGSAYVFSRNVGGTEAWGLTPPGKWGVSDAAMNDYYGRAVAIKGGIVIVGMFGDDDKAVDAGAAYVYQLQPDMILTKTVIPPVATPGQAITFTLTFSNAGDLTASGVVLTDTVPVSVTVNNVISSGIAITDTGAIPAYAWNIQDLAPGQGGVITLGVQISTSLSDSIFTNTATMTTTNGDADPGNNSSSATVRPSMSASITKAVMPQGQVKYGDALTYTLVVSAVPGVHLGLYDVLTDTTFVRFVGQPEGITHSNDVITGTLTVTPTQQTTVIFVVQVNVPGTAGLTTDVTNQACVYILPGTLGQCQWSNSVTNSAFRPYSIFLPVVLKN